MGFRDSVCECSRTPGRPDDKRECCTSYPVYTVSMWHSVSLCVCLCLPVEQTDIECYVSVLCLAFDGCSTRSNSKCT